MAARKTHSRQSTVISRQSTADSPQPTAGETGTLIAVPLAVVLAVVVRPWLWVTAVRALVALAPRRWWKRKPYLPIPDSDVVGWRKATAYGSSSADMTPNDVVSYLEWRRTNAP